MCVFYDYGFEFVVQTIADLPTQENELGYHIGVAPLLFSNSHLHNLDPNNKIYIQYKQMYNEVIHTIIFFSRL